MEMHTPKLKRRKGLMIFLIVVALVCIFVGFQILYIMFNGDKVARPDTPRGQQTIGSGPKLSYVVMGDSTAVSQGGDYDKGYAVKTAQYLARTHTVTWANVAVSGSRAKDVEDSQLAQALQFKPDVVLVAVGANDVTHMTSVGSVKESLTRTIDRLREQNPDIRIILTGSPDMGSVPRFAQPVRWYVGERAESLNRMVSKLSKQEQVTFAPIAEKTGHYFRTHPEAFAADNFHPTAQGYDTWTPILIEAIRQ